MSKVQVFLVQQRQQSGYVIKPAYVQQTNEINCLQYEENGILYVKGTKLGIKINEGQTNVEALQAIKDVLELLKTSLKKECPKEVSKKPDTLCLDDEGISILTHKERLNLVTEIVELKKRLEKGQEFHVEAPENPPVTDPKTSYISFNSPKPPQRQQVFVQPKKVYKVIDNQEPSQLHSNVQKRQNQDQDQFKSAFKALIRKMQEEQGIQSPEFIRKDEKNEETAFQVKKDKQQPTMQTPIDKEKTVRRHLREVLQEEKWQKLVSSQGSTGSTIENKCEKEQLKGNIKDQKKSDLNMSQNDEEPQEYVCEHYIKPDKRISLPNFNQAMIQSILSAQGSLQKRAKQQQGSDYDITQAFTQLDFDQRKKLFDQISNQLTINILTEQMDEVVAGVQEILNHELEESIDVDDGQQ